jgi:DNA-binding response OmpR family regulator
MKVLLVQNKPMLYTALKLTLLKKGFELVVANAFSSPVSTICNHHPSVIITDITNGGSFNFICNKLLTKAQTTM